MTARMLTVCFLLFPGAFGLAQSSGEETLKRVATHFPGVEDYSVTLDITPDIERLNVPPMHVRMFFKQPDKFHFESDNFALLPKEGLAFNPARLLARFFVDAVSDDSVDGRKGLRLLLRPKEERARAAKVVLYVDSSAWKPVRIVTFLFDGRTMTATFRYEEQSGHLMPSLLTVQFASPARDTTEQDSNMDEAAPMQRPRMPRNGMITIRYSDYQINTGLSDDIFDKK
jgi:outer membrane lipoprotein-sorting protein